MDGITLYICILNVALWLACIAVACVVCDTVLAIKRYINDKQYMKQMEETESETDTSGGNQHVQF